MELMFVTSSEILNFSDIDVDVWIQRKPSQYPEAADLELLRSVFMGGVDWTAWQKETVIRKEPLQITSKSWNDKNDHRKVVAQIVAHDGDTLFEAAETTKNYCNEAFALITNFIEFNRFWKRKCYKYVVMYDFLTTDIPIDISIAIMLASLAKNITVSMWINISKLVVRVSNSDELDAVSDLFFDSGSIEGCTASDINEKCFTATVHQLAAFDMMYVKYSKIVKDYLNTPRPPNMLKRVVEGILTGISGDSLPPPVIPKYSREEQRRMSVPELQISSVSAIQKKPDLVRNNSVRQILDRVNSPLISRCSTKILKRRDKSIDSARAVHVQGSIESTLDCVFGTIPNAETIYGCAHRECFQSGTRNCDSCTRKFSFRGIRPDFLH